MLKSSFSSSVIYAIAKAACLAVWLGFELKREVSLSTLSKNVVKTSAVEGENLNPEEVRSSIARRWGIDIAGLIPTSRDVEGIVEMMPDATRQFSKPLNKNRLLN